MSILTLSKNILNAFENVQTELNKLCLHIHDELLLLPICVDDGKGNLSDKRDRLIYALKHVHHDDSLAAQETFSCPGAIACTNLTLGLIEAVNEAKDRFKEVIHKEKQCLGADPYKIIRDVFIQAGHSIVKLRQVERHIQFIDYHPRRISWTKARNGANVIITYQEAHNLLLDKIEEGEHIKIQLAKLDLLKKDDNLVRHRDISPYWIINVGGFKTRFGSNYQKIRGSLPLFYLYDEDLPVPLVILKDRKKSAKLGGNRVDKLIEDKPFLPSINAYRYIKQNATPT